MPINQGTDGFAFPPIHPMEHRTLVRNRRGCCSLFRLASDARASDDVVALKGMSWNTSLVNAIAKVIAEEAHSLGVHAVFAPVVNMMGDPRFGRGQEGFGENPVLTSAMGVASVLGLQGGDGYSTGPSSYLEPGKVVSLGKHFAAYGAAIGALNGGPADVSNRTLHEVYLRPWIALARAGVRAVMPSHNTVGDIPAHGNKWLLDQVGARNLLGNRQSARGH